MLVILLLVAVILVAAWGIAKNAISYIGVAVILLAAIGILIAAGGINAKF